MPDVQLLQSELAQARGRYAALKDRHAGAPASQWPEDDHREAGILTERVDKIMLLIKDEQGKQWDATFDKIRSYDDDAIYKVPHGLNADDEGRKSLQRAGWEIKNGAVSIPTTMGMYELYAEDVIFGPLPTQDMAALEYFQKTRATMQPEYRVAFGKFMQLSAMFRSETQAMMRLTGPEQKALSEGTDSAGGYLVPPDTMAEILVRVAAASVMRGQARVVNTSRDIVKWPRVLPHTTSGSIYSSGFVGTWAAEVPAFTETDPGFGTFDIPVRKIRVATKLSNDFIADAITNVPQFLARNGAENMALVEDEGFISGDGTALRPQGILNGGATSVDVEGSTADTISNTTAAAGSAPKLITLNYTLPAQYAARASWLMRRATEGKIRQLVNGNGSYLWPPAIASAFSNAFTRTLFENPVLNSDFMPAEGTNGNKVLIYGDLSQYIIVQRAQISTRILNERFADTDQTGLILFERVGGALWNEDAIRYGIV